MRFFIMKTKEEIVIKTKKKRPKLFIWSRNENEQQVGYIGGFYYIFSKIHIKIIFNNNVITRKIFMIMGVLNVWNENELSLTNK